MIDMKQPIAIVQRQPVRLFPHERPCRMFIIGTRGQVLTEMFGGCPISWDNACVIDIDAKDTIICRRIPEFGVIRGMFRTVGGRTFVSVSVDGREGVVVRWTGINGAMSADERQLVLKRSRSDDIVHAFINALEATDEFPSDEVWM